MFGLRQHIKIKQAANALRDGRLDEAYAIATEKEIREFRGGQALLEKLVNPLLDRAARHLEEGHHHDALADVERALGAGGNRPRTAALRGEIRRAIDDRRKQQDGAHALLASVKGHLERGSVHAGKEILAQAPHSGTGVDRLARMAEHRERAGQEAVQRAETYLDQGEIEAALLAARRAVLAHQQDTGLPDLLVRLKKSALGRLEEAISSGNLKLAAGLLECLEPLYGSHLDLCNVADALAFMRKASDALARGEFDAARISLGRLAGLRPETPWIETGLGELDAILASLRSLRTGPLGLITASSQGQNHRDGPGLNDDPGGGRTVHIENPGARPVTPLPGAPTSAVIPPQRLLLWIDGIGTYLVLTADRVSIGRCGSSARPDIAISADLAGHHAEILRIEDDYFVVPARGTVRVGGVETPRKLLAPGDRLDLGKNCRLVFHMPTSMSTTAILGLHRAQRLEKDVRKVILLDRDIIIGTRGNCHIQASVGKQPVVITYRGGRLHCRSSSAISIDGRPVATTTASQAAGSLPIVNEVPVALGTHMQVGELSFTVTAPEGGAR